MNNKEIIGTILALATAIISGISIPANKFFVVGIDPTAFTAVRAIIIGTIFLFISLATKSFNFNDLKKDWKFLALIAVIGGSFAFLLFFTGLSLTTGSRGAFLHKTLPLYVAVFAFFLIKEKITKKQIYAMILMFAGTIAIFSATINPSELWTNPQLGDVLIIAATAMWALENVVARKVLMGNKSNFMVSFSRMFFGGVILFGVAGISGKLSLILSLTSQQWFNLFVSTGMLFGYVLLWYWSLRYINVSKAATLLLIAPVISTFLGVLWFSEPLPIIQVVGSVIILIGAYFMIGVRSRFCTGI